MTKGGPGTDGRLSSKRSAYACHAVYAVSFAAAQADHMQYGVTQHDVYFMSLGALCMSPWRTAPRRQPGRSGTWYSWSAGHAWRRRWRPLLQPEAGTLPSALTSYSVQQARLPVNIKVTVFDIADRICIKPHVIATVNVTAGEMHQQLAIHGSLYESASTLWLL